MYVIALNILEITWFLRNYKKGQLLKLYFLQNSPTVQLHHSARCWKRSWKPFCESLFSSSVAFLIISVASQKRRPFNADFSPENKKIRSWNQVRRVWGNTTVLSHCSLLRNLWPQAASVLEHCREGETKCWFSIFHGISFWPFPYGEEGQCTFIYSQ